MGCQVSVIIINYNTFDFTCKCIQSIYKNTTNVTFEIILIDNASTECAADIFKEIFPLITLIKSRTNLGFAGGNNLGLKYVTGEYVLLLNSDTELLNNAIGITYSKMKNDGTYVGGCKTYNYDGTLQYTAEMFPSIKLSLYRVLALNRIFNIVGLKKWQFNYTYENDFYPDSIWGSFFLFKREVLQLFHEQKLPDIFFMYGEDMLWCHLLRKKNIRINYYTEPRIKHYFSGDKIFKSIDENTGFKNGTQFLKNEYSFFSYYTICFLDIMFDITRLKWKDVIKKSAFYLSVNKL